MKRVFLIASVFLGFTAVMSAQDISENAIGLRLGDSDGFGAEVSYQRALGGDNSLLDVDFGIRDGKHYDGVKLAGIYHWVWNIDGGFNWYAGPGAVLASYSFDNVPEPYDVSETFIFIGGQIGIEYNFDIPLMISLDFRPEFGFGDDYYENDDLDFDIALGVRYQF